MLRYELLSGETIEVPDPGTDVARFFERLQAAVENPAVDPSAFLELLFSPQNPLLGGVRSSSNRAPTRAVLEDPAFHVMLDLLARKGSALKAFDPQFVQARFSMTVKEAAARTGVHENAIRQAIAARRLSSIKWKGIHHLDPAQVEAYTPSTRGPAPRLHVVLGSLGGLRLAIKHDGELVQSSRSGGVRTAHLDKWSAAAILAGPSRKSQLWIIGRGPHADEIDVSPFVVRGRFDVIVHVGDSSDAAKRFRAFTAGGRGSRRPAT